MKKVLIVFFTLLLALAAGCGGDNGENGDNGGGDAAAGRVAIGEYDLPVYPGAETVSETGMNASYTTSEGPDAVRAWYDEAMTSEGWQANQDWYDMDEQKQRIFFKGEPQENPDFGEQNVIIGVGPNEGNGSIITIAPILNRYEG